MQTSSVYCNQYKTEIGNKSATNEQRYFFESNFVKDKILFFLVHSNQDNDSKRFKIQRYYLG